MENVVIDTQLVWMTCGIDAGYQILLAPPALGKTWVDLLEGAFPNFEVGDASLKTVEINYEGGKALALAFFDPELCDGSSRPIKHFMLLLGINDAVFKKAPLLLIPPLLKQLKPAFDVICQASRYSSEQEIMRQAQQQQSERNIRLEFASKLSSFKLGNKNKQVTGVQKAVTTRDVLPPIEQQHPQEEALAMPVWLKWAFLVVVLVAMIAGIWVGLTAE
ncbi:MAG: hypothetical protein H6996_09210 [Moraxellaceae bacterium]|nr:hypothetical protein [Moraxellaceae bacterium]MCP5177030.1 hypothetical protein [Moraxellaceae bacterium]